MERSVLVTAEIEHEQEHEQEHEHERTTRFATAEGQ
jgi:hypothetical protein